jgi:hypothetical protein
MASRSPLRCLVWILLTATTARAQTPVEIGGPPIPTDAQPVVWGPVTSAPCAAPVPSTFHSNPFRPVVRLLDGVGHLYDVDWLDLDNPRPRYKYWLDVDYARMWISDVALPPLITSSASGVPLGFAGVLGQSTTATRVGGYSLSPNPSSGLFFSAGSWVNSLEDRGLEINGLFWFGSTRSFTAFADGSPNSITLARPVIDAGTGRPAAFYTGFAGILAGASSASVGTDLWGVDANCLGRCSISEAISLTLLGGLRTLSFDQAVVTQDTSIPLGATTIPVANAVVVSNPNLARITDSFDATNRFFGGQVGFRTNIDTGRLGLGFGFKIALGSTFQTLDINGRSEAVTPGGQVFASVPGGLLANSANIGRYEHNAFSVVPNIDLRVSYRLCDNLHAFFSYDYLLWNHVLTPAPQISRTVNGGNVPTSGVFNAGAGAIGSSTLTQTNFAVNSLLFGLRWTY